MCALNGRKSRRGGNKKIRPATGCRGPVGCGGSGSELETSPKIPVCFQRLCEFETDAAPIADHGIDQFGCTVDDHSPFAVGMNADG